MSRRKSTQFSREIEDAFRVIEAASERATVPAHPNWDRNWSWAANRALAIQETDSPERAAVWQGHYRETLEEIGVTPTPELFQALAVVGRAHVEAFGRADAASHALLNETRVTSASQAKNALRQEIEDALTDAADWERALRRALPRPRRPQRAVAI